MDLTPKQTRACPWESLPITIAEDSALSEAIDLHGLRLFGIVIPNSWTEANLTFQMSPDGGATWADIKDQNGNELLAIVDAVSDCIALDPSQFAAFQHLRLRSGTTSSAIAQTSTRTLQLILRTV